MEQQTNHGTGAIRAKSGSVWQSLTRSTGSVETDYLNGEIVLLGRLHRIPTPELSSAVNGSRLSVYPDRMGGP